MSADDLIGHRGVLQRLSEALNAGRLPHGLLLTGPAAVGKTTLALELAAHALGGDSWPGGRAAHPDLWLEDSAEESIRIERIQRRAGSDTDRPLLDLMAMRPFAGGRRVAVIARAERFTETSADVLMKTLEEPPPGTLLILCATTPEALRDTLVSRLLHVGLAPVPAPEITAWLRGRGVDEALARFAASLSGGRPGRALRLATEPGALRAEVAALHGFLAVAGTGLDGALGAVAALALPSGGAEARERVLSLLAVWASFVRDAALTASSVDEGRLWSDYTEPLERWADSLGAARLTDILGLLLRASADIGRYAQPRLTIEALFLEIFAGPQQPPPTPEPPLPAVVNAAPQADAGPPARHSTTRRARAPRRR
ncbi:MAG: DNA polymerase III subunit [Candidatus Dormibacteria bacterium]